MSAYDSLSDTAKAKAMAIIVGCEAENLGALCQVREMACALALLTSSVKAEREQGKEMVRGWRKA
jgi:hypothetical protein